MNFGLKNAAQSWQRYMDQILRGLNFVFCFLDDILIASTSINEHKRHVQKVLDIFAAEGLTVNKEKCVMAKTKVVCLGHLVNKDGIKPLPKKVDNLTTFPLPTSVTDLRRFLGMLNFYRRHIPHAAIHQQPLVEAIPQPSKKKDKRPIEWTEQRRLAFKQCKSDLQTAALLAHPSPKGRLSLTTDASEVGIGAVLQQEVNGKISPLGFFSKTLTSAQMKYSTFDRELLAIFEGIKHFRDFIEGREFCVITDHKPLTTSLHQDRKTASPRRLRQMEFISQFTTDIRYTPGTSNIVADALSRPSPPELNELTEFPTGRTIALEQQKDKSFELRKLIENGRLAETSIPSYSTKLWCDVSGNQPRPYIPTKLRKSIFQHYHSLSHPGIRATRDIVRTRAFWPKMNTDLRNWVQACDRCAKFKEFRHPKTTPEQFEHSLQFDHIHLDLVGPLAPSEGYKYCYEFLLK
ncbi:hypothetical protein GE061_007563 [Apolygus lucorum]|uniref:RNA-directed DNA polymerase n=1 Tax=Apolygus lucorum TaxID=248454 RepID=A0A8S9WS91_APOLU|nr:hypothetical protein GE061_007563 [Apolygus lucorum]